MGVVLCITPFNYPINLLIAKIAPAIICGNTVIIKSSTKESLVISAFIQLLHKKINKGIINLLLLEGKNIGDSLFNSKNIACINFTGSSHVGKKITEQMKLIPLILEMSGKDVAIVLKDANLKQVAKEIIKEAFNFNS